MTGMRAGDVNVKDIVDTLSNEALVHMARTLAQQLREPTQGCIGEPEMADVMEVLCDRLVEASDNQGSEHIRP